MSRSSRFILVAVGALLIGVGLPHLVGGAQLISLGGSFYYAMAGVALIVSGVLLVRRRLAGVWVFGALLLGTLLWAFAEVGSALWLLIPRIVVPLVLAMLVALCLPALLVQGAERGQRKKVAYWIAGLLGMVVVCIAACAFHPSPIQVAPHVPSAIQVQAASKEGEQSTDTEWRHYGRTAAGTRFSPADQIRPDNVQQLKVAWVFRWGDTERLNGEEQSTPLQVGNALYFCTNRNIIIALDADSGSELWRFDAHSKPSPLQRCRGVGYYEVSAASHTRSMVCQIRIVTTTIDARLLALDAKTGRLCPDFGAQGIVDLKVGMGSVEPGDYYQTSAPAVVRDLVVIGGRVEDGRRMDMPSGVIRAFSAITGELVWAWDPGNPVITRLPREGENYSKSSPNMWSTPVYDEDLGLLYVSLGVPTGATDFWGGWRTPDIEKYASSIVALDISTGRPRWHFQTVHHDVWDYDLPSQATLVNIPNGNGATTPALIQPTKRGQIFLLDRRNGEALAPIEEKRAPKGVSPNSAVSLTQPYSVGMPSVGAEQLTEASMWGVTPFDQLWCRIQFRKMRYEGDFTPPSTTPTLLYSGWFGGMNWGGVSVDGRRGVLIANDIRVPLAVRLVSREAIERSREGRSRTGERGHGPFMGSAGPFSASVGMFMSPLGIPCNAPPWGTMTAIDFTTRQIRWQIPMGTARDSEALPLGLPLPIGLPTLGGSLVTGSGLVFFSGTQDFYLRALDEQTGQELWKGRLPVGTQATPMTYLSPKSRRQLVVVVAGGAPLSNDKGDYVVAFALPIESPIPQITSRQQ